MKKYLRIISAILVICLLSTCVYAKDSMFGERDEWHVAESYIDDVYKYDFETSSSNQEEEGYPVWIEDVVALGIMSNDENGNFKENEIVTEKELAQIINILRYHGDSYLESSHQMYGSDEKVTLKTAIAAIVEVLGYSFDASLIPVNGELSVASKLGITKNIDTSKPGSFVTRDIMAHLIYNSFGVDVQIETINGKYRTTEVKKGVSILNEYMDIVEVDGLLNSINGLNIFSTKTAKEGTVEIDRVAYYTDTYYGMLYGKRVEGYAKKSDIRSNSYDIILLRENNQKMPTLEYNYILDENLQISSGQLLFEDETGSQTEYSISDIDYATFNGDIIEASKIEDMLSQHPEGKISFAATSGSGEYNIAVIVAYERYKVLFFSSSDGKIMLDYGITVDGKEYIELPYRSVVRVTDASGALSSTDVLSNKTSIMIYQNSAKSYTDIVVSDKKLIGAVSGIQDARTVILNENMYRIANSYTAASDAKTADVIDVEANGTFYITADGYIAGYEGTGAIKWGFLRAIGAEREGRLSSKYIAKIFTQDGEWKLYTVAEKAEVDGQNMKGAERICSYVQGVGLNDLVRFRANGSDEITFLDTVNNLDEYEADDAERVIYQTEFSGIPIYTDGFAWESNPYHIMSTTALFEIPEDLDREDDYTMFQRDTFKTYYNDRTSTNVRFYSPDDMFICGGAIVQNKTKVVSDTSYVGSSLFGIESITRALDKEGNPVYKLKGWQWKNNPVRVEKTINEKFLENNEMPVVGGVYRYAESNGNLNLELVVKDGVMPNDFITNPANFYERACGTILKVTPTIIKISIDGEERSFEMYSQCSIMRYDTASKKFRQINYSQLYVGEKIFICGSVDQAGGCLVVE